MSAAEGRTAAPGRPRIDAGARRGQVVVALWRVVVRDGLEAVTARAVAAEAGLSLSAVTRFFPLQEELHLAAMQRVVDRVRQRLAELGPAPDPATAVEQRLSEVLPLTEETRAEAAVYYAYLARSRSVPRLREVADAVDEALAGMCRDAVATVAPGRADADRCTQELHALTEGLAYALVTWPHRRSPDQASTVLRSWLARLAADTRSR